MQGILGRQPSVTATTTTAVVITQASQASRAVSLKS